VLLKFVRRNLSIRSSTIEVLCYLLKESDILLSAEGRDADFMHGSLC